jgi:hypothetical protein
MEVGQCSNWGCSAKGKKKYEQAVRRPLFFYILIKAKCDTQTAGYVLEETDHYFLSLEAEGNTCRDEIISLFINVHKGTSFQNSLTVLFGLA